MYPKINLANIATLKDSSIARLARSVDESSIRHLIRAMENNPLIRLNKQIEEVTRAMRLFEQQRPAVIAFLEKTEAIQRTLANPTIIDGLNRIHEHSTAISRALEQAILPTAGAINELSTQLAHLVEPYQTAVSSISAWQATLAARMTSLEIAWALPDRLGDSMIGFARLSRLSDAVHMAEPYAEPVSELVAAELGGGLEANGNEEPIKRDAAAVEAGLNPELIAFPPSKYNRVVFAAGFEFHFVGAPVPQAVESADPEAVFDPMHSFVLTEVEQRLRQLVEKRLQALAGRQWIRQRVSEPVRKRWIERRSEERAAGRPVFALVQYADFMDLVDIICQTNNWRDVFQPIFQNSDDFRVSLCRLHPVRKAIAHGRPLGRADVLTLVSEATRILGALGLRVLTSTSPARVHDDGTASG